MPDGRSPELDGLAAALFDIPVVMLGMVLFRGLPFVLYALGSSSLRPSRRIGCAAAFCAATALYVAQLKAGAAVLLGALAGLAYFALCALVIERLPRLVRAQRLDRPTLFVGCALAFLMAPALAAPKDLLVPIAVIGFELIFAAYSYAVDVAGHAPDAEPSRRRMLFFLLVDPTLVFRRSARRVARPEACRRGLARIGLGLLALCANQLLLLALSAGVVPEPPDLVAVASARAYAVFLGYYFVIGWSIYMAHSGVASLQIGCLRLLGYEAPERYRYPFLATGARDFWRRWNRYLGQWLELYVFRPLARRLPRQRLRPGAVVAIAVFGTFVLNGALHEYMQFTLTFDVSGGALLGLTLHGAALCVGLGLQPLAARVPAALRIARTPWTTSGARIVAHAGFLQFALLSAWLLVPALSGEGLPPALRALFEP